jgi:uncharacterized protein YcaQ
MLWVMPFQGLAAPTPVIRAAAARRMLLGAQGLLDDPARRATPSALCKLIQQMGFVQIDSINTIERAHHLILFSRLPEYRSHMLARLLEDTRELFEHWTHDASAIPTPWFPHWRHRFERHRRKMTSHKWWQMRMGPEPEKTIEMVMQRIRRDGPLLSRDFEHDRNNHQLPEDSWWGWKPQKAALEHLWRTGELAVAKRINFQKVYDLTERVLPQSQRLPIPDLDEHIDWACRSALERLGPATPREIAAFWNAVDLAQARQWCEKTRQRGEIIEVRVEALDGSAPKPAFMLADRLARALRLPSENQVDGDIRLLAPFDPALRDRHRTRRLFNFDYTLEAFVPARKRRYGYYVLPMLEGDALIGRLDPKFHRERGTVEVRGLWLEPRVKPTKARKRKIDAAVERLAEFVGASSIIMPRPNR